MWLQLFCLLFGTAQAAFEFGDAQVLGQVTSPIVFENSGLGASRVHSGILYGHNDGGDIQRIFAMNPTTGDVVAEYMIDVDLQYDWEDMAVGVCGQGLSGSCIYIADIGGNERPVNAEQVIYKVREPDTLSNSTLPVLSQLNFTWDEPDAEGIAVDPNGEVYVISKVNDGNGLMAKLPSSAWGIGLEVHIPDANTARLGTHDTPHVAGQEEDVRDPRGADLSPDGRNLLVKARDYIFFIRFSENMDYIGELSRGEATPVNVTSYVRRANGQAVAWNPEGTGFYTLPEGRNPIFHYYTFRDTDELVG